MEENQNAGADNTGGAIRENQSKTTNDFTTLDTFLAAFFPDENETIYLRHLEAKGEPDKSYGKNLHTTRAKLASDTAQISELQSLNTKRGIYFVVNAGGNKGADIKRYTACFAERDEGTLEEQHRMLDAAPLMPSIRVETKRSVHAYWLLKGGRTAEEWREVQRLLIKHFDGDKAISDPPRPMRLPGYNHVTYNAETKEYEYKPVTVTQADYTRRYAITELQTAFAKPKATSKDTARTANDVFLSESEISTPEKQERAKELLPLLSPERCNEEPTWYAVLTAIHNIFAGADEGKALARGWSKQSPKYNDDAFEDRWARVSTEHENKIGLKSLIEWAREDSPDAFADQAAATSLRNRQNDFTTRAGFLYYTGKGKDGEPQNIRIAGAIEIVAITHDENEENFGRLLEFTNTNGNKKRYALPMSLLAGDGNQYRAELLSNGAHVELNPNAKRLLDIYIQTYEAPARFLCVPKVGWYDKAFVLPDVTIGNAGDKQVIFQTEVIPAHRLKISGDLAGWQENVARFCVGNTRLAFAVSAAFAGCIAPLLGQAGGGFHFRGTSSVGKTTALLVAGSVWGGNPRNGYIQTWRTTTNGLEAVAEIHNHGLLCLDEISQCNEKEVGDIAYQLANEQGKVRMGKTGNLRRQIEYTLIFLSSGEQSLTDVVTSAGKRIKGGQEVRMVDLEANAGRGLGLFDTLHGYAKPSQLAEHLRSAALAFYGAPIRAFLAKLTTRFDVLSLWASYRDTFAAGLLQGQPSGEVERVCTRCALVGFAGEIATKLGVTGWDAKTASDAAQEMFRVWLSGRGTTGAGDIENGICAVREFIEAYGASRFQSINENSALIDDRNHVNNRAGFKRTKDGATEYLILPAVFRGEICKSYDSKAIAKELANRGILKTQSGGGYTVNERLPEIGVRRVYAVRLPDE